mmetsp:Transcript_16717/g.46704  ORF Transcript_16717/g.46704 Transcript_16717/m.46704 type:complete len:213 (+) Transcript_16717:523-1161(+)
MLKAGARHAGEAVKAFHQLQPDPVKVLLGVFVLHCDGLEVQLVLWRKVIIVLVGRQLWVQLLPEEGPSLKGPAACHVADGIPATAQHQHGHPKALHETQARGMAFYGEVEHTQAVPRERIGACLEDYSSRFVHVHHLLHNGHEELGVRLVVHAILQGGVEGIELPLSAAGVVEVARAREEVTKLVEGNRHHTVCGVESLLDAVPMVDVDVNV